MRLCNSVFFHEQIVGTQATPKILSKFVSVIAKLFTKKRFFTQQFPGSDTRLLNNYQVLLPEYVSISWQRYLEVDNFRVSLPRNQLCIFAFWSMLGIVTRRLKIFQLPSIITLISLTLYPAAQGNIARVKFQGSLLNSKT